MKHSTTLAILTALVAILAACSPSGGPLGTVPPAQETPSGSQEPDLTPAPTPAPPAGSPTPSGSLAPGSAEPSPSAPSSPAGTTIVRAYFYLGGEPGSAGLVAVLREVPETRAVATAAMNALLEGPTADESAGRLITSAVPPGSRLLDLAIEDGVATVDLSREFESGGGSASVLIRLGQVVYTLTQFPTVRSVSFEIEGSPVTVFGSEGVVLDGPVARADYVDLLPAIFVDRPAWGAALGNPGRITGSSNVFEATSRVTLLDAAGRIIADEVVTATCGTGCRGTFDVTVRYDVADSQWGTLRVWEASARDGSPQNVRDYRVWLTPPD
jgi:spore germination protein GerM